METPVTFRNQDQQIVGMIHLPKNVGAASAPRQKFPAVCLFHGFTGTKIEPHRIFVLTARALANAGIVALRFDFRGSGESEGDFQDMTVAGEVSDGLVALDFLCQQPQVDSQRLGLLGLSLGGVIAMLVAAHLSKRSPRSNAPTLHALHPLKSLVLWSAPAAGGDLVRARTDPKALESFKTRGFADRNGNAVGSAFVNEYALLAQAEELKKSDCPVLIIHGAKDESVPVDHAHRVETAARKPRRNVEKLILPEADHTFNRLDWQQQVIEASVRWFEETLKGETK